jgi:(5-formylfuran-3-yl)methyl phosphate synthase
MIWRGLLVSVRDAAEADAALAGGAAIIDVKDPAAGSLGAASATAVASVAATVGERVPWTVAAGELRDEMARPGTIHRWLAAIAEEARTARVAPAAVKVGLAGLNGSAWQRAFHDVMDGLPATTARVAVAYADWQRVGAPHPLDIVAVAREANGVLLNRVSSGVLLNRVSSGVLLIDTADKSGPDLLQACSWADLEAWVAAARNAGMAVALAGRLRMDAIPGVGQLRPDVVALRSAVCLNHRLGPVDATLVRRAVAAVGLLEKPSDGTARTSRPAFSQP